MDPPSSSDYFLNLNIGILGHVDSGKTSLAKALSSIPSTAAFDKNPQSKERGITIDLGFSALVVDCPSHLVNSGKTFHKLQFTFVDCPGHASLIRTIIGGAQIIHLMMLVLDVTKGMQTQTAECLVIGEIMCKHMVVVLNKVDMLPEEKRTATVEKMCKKMKLTLANTIFKDAPIIAVAANPSGKELNKTEEAQGLHDLVDCLKSLSFLPDKNINQPLVFSVDHCFSIRGQGTIMTGTVLQGAVCINDMIEIPSLHTVKKVKSMQMFHRPVQRAEQGDRLGICVTQFDPKQLERGIVCQPGYVSTLWGAILTAHHIKYFRGHIRTKDKFHISIGYETVMASILVFQCSNGLKDSNDGFNFDTDYEWKEELEENNRNQFILLRFEQPVNALPNGLAIGSRLDMDVNGQACRLAFWGRIARGLVEKNYEETVLPCLKVYKTKSRKGIVERIASEDQLIVKNLIKKETNAQPFVGLQVEISSGEKGVIDSTFGKSGKLKIYIPGGLTEDTLNKYKESKNKMSEGPLEVILKFKRYIYDAQKKMVQPQILEC